MRKQKIIKMTASPLDPSLGGSFQPPATHNGDISIVFRGKDMSIHGWDGSAWSTIYTRNGNDKQFTFPHTYENYYVKSLTGSDETFSASFFSTGKYERSTPLLAGVQRDTKLHDIEEVPIYTASDANKLLTIMSDGSLRWLGISESYVVELIGTGGGSTGNASGLEDLAELQLLGGATMTDGVLSLSADGDAATLSHSESYEIRESKTISMWMKRDPFTGPTTQFLGKTLANKAITYGATSYEGWSLQLIKGQNTSTNVTNYLKNNGWHTNGMLRWIASNTASTHGIDSSSFWKLPYAIDDGEWHHIVFQIDDVAIGTQPKSRMFVDGNLLTEGVSCRNNGSTIVQIGADGWLLNRFHVGQSTSARELQFGRFMLEGETPAGFFGGDLDGVNIDSGIMTDSEISDMFNAGRATPAAPAGTPAPTLLSQSTPSGDASYNASTDVMTFDGTGDYATFAGSWKYTDAITYGAWFKTTATGDRRIMSSHVRSGSPVRNGFLLYLNNGRLDFFEPSFSAGNYTLTGPTGMNDGQWHHVALSWNANSNWVLYVDGQQYSTNSNGAQAPAYMDGWDLYIGANSWNGNNPYGFFDGQIGRAFVENEAMTLEQVQAIYDNGPEYVETIDAPTELSWEGHNPSGWNWSPTIQSGTSQPCTDYSVDGLKIALGGSNAKFGAIYSPSLTVPTMATGQSFSVKLEQGTLCRNNDQNGWFGFYDPATTTPQVNFVNGEKFPFLNGTSNESFIVGFNFFGQSGETSLTMNMAANSDKSTTLATKNFHETREFYSYFDVKHTFTKNEDGTYSYSLDVKRLTNSSGEVVGAEYQNIGTIASINLPETLGMFIGGRSRTTYCSVKTIETMLQPAPAESPAGNFIESNLSPGNIASGDNVLGNNTTYDETEGKLVVTGSGHTKIDVAGELTSIPFNDDGSEKVAISMWLKLDSWSGYPILFSSRNESGNQLFNMRLWRNNGFMVGSRHSKSAGSTANLFTNVGPANTVNNLSDGNWHNLVYYFDGATSGEQRIYLDGSLVATRQHSDGAGQGEINYVDSAMRYFGIGDLNNALVMNGEYDSIVLYQGFEFTEAMAAEVYADSTRQTIVSQP